MDTTKIRPLPLGHLGSLAAAIFPPLLPNGLFAIVTGLAGYFDESGTGLNDEVLVVGGYVARVSDWSGLIRDWARALTKAGLDPATQCFHRAVFEARKVPHMRNNRENYYADWSDRKAAAVLTRLNSTISRRILGSGEINRGLGISVSVVTKDYEAVRGAREFPGNRYNFCVLHCLAGVTAWLKRERIQESVAYIFDQGAGDRGEQFVGQVNQAVAQIFADPSRRKEHRFEALAFKDKREFPQLQAADFTLWDVRDYYRAHLRGVAAKGLGIPTAFYSHHFDRQELERTREQSAKLLRAADAKRGRGDS